MLGMRLTAGAGQYMPKAKKRSSARQPSKAPPPPLTGWRRATAKLKWKWVNSALVVAVVAAVVSALATHWLNRPPAAHTTAASPQLQVDSVLVTPQILENGGLPRFDDEVYFSLRNIGDQLAIITGVKLQVQQFAQVNECFSAGSLATTGWSSVNLPTDPAPGTVATVPVSQQMAPDTADKFEVSLHVPKWARGLQVYRFHVWVLYDQQVPLNAGYLVVSLPEEPQDGGYFWSRSLQANPDYLKPFASNVKVLSQCLINNSDSLHAIVSLSGARSAQMADLPALLAYRY
jgi:hypothetical protein